MIEDYKKLLKLQEEGCRIYCGGEALKLWYNSLEEDVDEVGEEVCCTFEWIDDRHGITNFFEDFKDCEWTVERCVRVDWKNT